MLDRVFSLWFWFGSSRPGFFLGTAALSSGTLLLYNRGVHASLSVGPGGDFPRFTDLFLYAFSHEDLPSLLINTILLLLLGPCQERRWGTVAFVALSLLSAAMLPPLYALVLFVGSGEASRICGYSAIQLALFTAQCRQVTQKRLLGCVPIWFLPWLVLLASLVLLPGTPALLHFCAICLGHNYRQSFIGVFQELEDATIFKCVPEWVCVPTAARLRLPTYTTSERSESPSQSRPPGGAGPSADAPSREPWPGHQTPWPGHQTPWPGHQTPWPGQQSPWPGHQTPWPGQQSPWPGHQTPWPGQQSPWPEPLPSWAMEGAAALSEQQLLEEQMIKAGILASLQDTSEDLEEKVEVPKSSVSSLRLQQLERMGFPTEKAVVALAASKQLDGAISLLIDDRVGDKSVMVSKGKSALST